MSYFPPYGHSKNKIEVELDLSNYATKSDLKKATSVDTSQFAKKDDLADLKSETDKLDFDKFKNVSSGLGSLKDKIDKLDFGKLETTPIDFGKLSDVVKNDVVKRFYMMNWLKKLMPIMIIKSVILKEKYQILLT